jgi:hypothetical protein
MSYERISFGLTSELGKFLGGFFWTSWLRMDDEQKKVKA